MARQNRKSAADITAQVGRILDLAAKRPQYDNARTDKALQIQRTYFGNMAKIDKGENGRRDLDRKFTRNQRMGISNG